MAGESAVRAADRWLAVLPGAGPSLSCQNKHRPSVSLPPSSPGRGSLCLCRSQGSPRLPSLEEGTEPPGSGVWPSTSHSEALAPDGLPVKRDPLPMEGHLEDRLSLGSYKKLGAAWEQRPQSQTAVWLWVSSVPSLGFCPQAHLQDCLTRCDDSVTPTLAHQRTAETLGRPLTPV